jgi:hypothetical protein
VDSHGWWIYGYIVIPHCAQNTTHTSEVFHENGQAIQVACRGFSGVSLLDHLPGLATRSVKAGRDGGIEHTVNSFDPAFHIVDQLKRADFTSAVEVGGGRKITEEWKEFQGRATKEGRKEGRSKKGGRKGMGVRGGEV